MKKFNFEKFGFIRNLIFIGFFALFLCLLLFATTFDVHASDTPSVASVLPYKPNPNDYQLSDNELQIIQDYLDTSGYNHNIFNEDCFIFKTGEGAWWDYSNYVVVPYYTIIFPASSTTFSSSWSSGISASNFEFYNSNDYIDISFACSGITIIARSGGLGWFSNSFGNSSYSCRLFGLGDSVHVNNGFEDFYYKTNYPVYTNFTISTLDPFRYSIDILAPSSSSGQSGVGHATVPNNDPNNLINGPSGNPISRPTKPTPTPFTPTIWNPPNIDTSTIETLLESIWECLDYGFNYLKDNIGGYFSNLLSNLDGWFEYLVDSVFYAVNKIVKSIQDLATDLYNNFVSLFEPIYDFLSSVSSFFSSLVDLGTDESGNFTLTNFFVKLLIPDTDDLSASLLQGDIFAVVPLSFAIKNFVDTFIYTINNLQVSKVFTIPGFTAFGQTFPSYQMDFSWFDDYKPYSDTIISGFLLIGYMHWFFVQASSMLRGAGVVGHEQSTDASKKVGD